MGHKWLKVSRVIISLIFLILTALLFLDYRGTFPTSFFGSVLYLQFVPSLLKFIHILGFAAIGFIIITLLTLLFGRVYCSTICPFGILQDAISFISRKFRKKKRYKYSKPHSVLRYVLLALPVLLLILGSVYLINLLDPYSNFGRIFSDLFRPVAIGINNLMASLFQKMNIYAIYPVAVKKMNIATLWFPLAILFLVVWMAAFHGRLYCNTICPVGTLLGLLSKVSIFRVKFDDASCTKCGKCAVVCKSECINIKEMEVDFSRCVGCFNCIQACPSESINYKSGRKRKPAIEPVTVTNTGKREFLTKTLFYGVGLFGLSKMVKAQPEIGGDHEFKPLPNNKKYPVSPPGSLSIEHFKDKCTACHLCVSACPTQVLQPSFLEYGFTGMLQPRMDFHVNYCNYECTICSEVCPTGAILPLSKESKKTTQIGRVHFIMHNCVVHTDNTACGSCSEHCPTQAVRMVPYEGDLTIPEVNPDICVGCGACEYACPVRPHRAIYVDGNPEHLVAEKPKEEKIEEETTEEFPF